MTDTQWLDATDQAALVARGEVSPAELIEAAISRIEALDGAVNAVVIRTFEQARERAAQPVTGPFAGVPFLYKNLGGSEAGDPLTLGMKALAEADFRAPADSFLAARFREAGLISLGKTNVPEMAIKATTEPDYYGPTRNPWNLAHSAGGSSGGSAAAVAAGMVPVAHASDGGGSIRIPASECGLVGLKPSRGRVTAGPAAGEVWRGLAHEFVVSRSVRDSAALLDWVGGPFPGDPWGAPGATGGYLAGLDAPLPPLRIGLLERSPVGWPTLHDDCVVAVREAARLLESLGHHVEISHPAALDEIDYRPAILTTIAVHTAETFDALGAALGRPLTSDDMEPWTWALADHGRSQSLGDYLAIEHVFNAFSRGIGGWWRMGDQGVDRRDNSGFDLLLSPTLLTPPPVLGASATPVDDPMRSFDILHDFLPFTPIANVTGQPAISLPLHWNAAGLPVGVQLMGAIGREDLLLRVAAQVELAAPWAGRRPPLG